MILLEINISILCANKCWFTKGRVHTLDKSAIINKTNQRCRVGDLPSVSIVVYSDR